MQTFIMKQSLISIGNKYVIYNTDHEVCYQIVGGYIYACLDRLLGGLCAIAHETAIKDTKGQSLLTVKKRNSGVFENYDIKKSHEVIASVSTEKKWLTTAKLNIVTPQTTYYIKGDIFAKHFFVYDDKEQELIHVRKFMLSLRDAYEITLVQEIDPAFAMALLYIIDSTYHN